MLADRSLTPGQSAYEGFPAFDQRPGDLEATRGLVPVVYGHRPDGGPWQVVLAAGGVRLAQLSPAQAEQLATELQLHARTCEAGNTGADPLA